MGVEVEGQPIMADVVGRIGGFGHCADRQGRDQILLLFAVDVLHQLVDILGQGLAGRFTLHLVAEPQHKTAQLGELVRIGFVVDSIDECTFTVLYTGPFAANKFGHFAVGQQHELFDQLVRLFHLFEVDA